MKGAFVRHIALVFWTLLAIAGCSGGTGGSGATAGTDGTGISFGTVTDLGSIFVNGVEFSTNGATIKRDDVSINESELRRGMIVEVQGSITSSTSGAATTVTVEEAVRGPVESKTGTASAGTLVVLGQTVQVDDTTLIDNNICNPGEACSTHVERFAAVDVDDLLEVHGHRRADGSIAASFIERKTAPVVFVVRGTVAGHNAVAQTFTVGALTVNYNGANINDMPAPSSNNWNNLFVEVKGTSCAGVLPVCGTLTATKVEPEGLDVANANQAEIESFVTAVRSTSDFTLGNQPVVTTAATRFEGGLPTDIVVGVKLEVEGVLAGGILTATKVSFRDSVKLESDVATTGAASLTLVGLSPITVIVNSLTEFKGGANSLADIAPGEHVRIRGRVASGNSVIATEVEQRSPDTNVVLQGPVGAIVNPMLTILGVTVNTTGIQDQNFEGVDDNPIGRAAFFNTVRFGDLVKAQGELLGLTVSWDEIELED